MYHIQNYIYIHCSRIAVHAGDVIGIIEAMKLMNEVTADCDGTVKEVAAENGTMVEYGQPLVILN